MGFPLTGGVSHGTDDGRLAGVWQDSKGISNCMKHTESDISA
jgi:hypothetical protein